MGGDTAKAIGTVGLSEVFGKGTFMNDLVSGDPFASKRRQQKKLMDEQRAANAKIEKDIADRQAKEKEDSINQATKERRRALRRAARPGGAKRGTVLTSPLGIPGQAQTSGKTLLGS